MGSDANSQLFDLVRDLTAKVAALTAILERVEEDRKEDLKRVEESRKEDLKRIHDLEMESARRKGIMAVVGAIGGVVGTVAVWIIKHIFGGGS